MGWQVTATTTKCAAVSEFVTIMVYPDGTAKCSQVVRYSKVSDGRRKLTKCSWPECQLVSAFCREALAL